MLNVDEAVKRIVSQIQPLDSNRIPLKNALGRILAEDVESPINLPPFANSSMDGYAVRSQDVQETPVSLQVAMDIPAGVAPSKSLEAGEAARIMTGAPMPDGADGVIPVEDTDADWSQGSPKQITVKRTIQSGDYVRPAGEDIRKGEQVLKHGIRLRPQELGILAALGWAEVNVSRQPRVVILSSGDELVDVDEVLTPGKIRDVNSYTLAGLVTDHGGIPIVLPPAKDTLESVHQMFQDALAQQPDMIISSAGVSVGAADYIRDVLAELGEVDFWRINLRPGKPLAFGKIQDVPFFGLPGNPVSAMVTFEVLVRPALYKQMSQPDDWTTVNAIIAENLNSDGRQSYIRVKLKYEGDQLVATTTGTQSSGALMSMVLADGLLIIPEGVKAVDAGTSLQVRLLRSI